MTEQALGVLMDSIYSIFWSSFWIWSRRWMFRYSYYSGGHETYEYDPKWWRATFFKEAGVDRVNIAYNFFPSFCHIEHLW